ncbi:hypothetical protein BJ165DRAFT_1409857 [Panaeolus papilionaceus]|nr:hypothetical protein BJ165DRAFT_1409857 [Panaeolus papilionaceus]
MASRISVIWDDKHIEGWKNIVDAVHEAGGRVYAQLWHDTCWDSRIRSLSHQCSRIPGTPDYVTPTAVPDPRAIIAQFKQAAINAKIPSQAARIGSFTMRPAASNLELLAQSSTLAIHHHYTCFITTFTTAITPQRPQRMLRPSFSPHPVL